MRRRRARSSLRDATSSQWGGKTTAARDFGLAAVGRHVTGPRGARVDLLAEGA
jgi:hypothetical protein